MAKISAIQLSSTASVRENLIKTQFLINTAVQQGSQLVVLPEVFASFDAQNTREVAEKFGHGPIQAFLASEAKKHKVWIVGGTIPILYDDATKPRSSCIIFDDNGNIVESYSKIHLFDANISNEEVYNESFYMDPGKQVTVLNSPFGKLGISICFDLRFPELFRHMTNLGAEIFIVPSAFTYETGKAHWDVLTKSRAIENISYLVAANQVGTHANGRRTYGHSVIIDPWGRTLTSIKDEVGVITADIDLQQIHTMRNSLPVLSSQKIFFDTSRL